MERALERGGVLFVTGLDQGVMLDGNAVLDELEKIPVERQTEQQKALRVLAAACVARSINGRVRKK
jgi:hypothetical protein